MSRSSTEAKYRALADFISELLALRWLLEDMSLTHFSLTVIHCDNCSAIQIAHNDVFHERTKHIEIDCHLVCHYLSAGILRLLLLALLIRLLTSLRRLFLLVVFVILFPNSRWLLLDHLEFEGNVNICI